MAQILSGKQVSAALSDQLKLDVEKLKASGIDPTLGILRIGAKPDDIAYERGATKRAETVGVSVKNYQYDSDISQEMLISELRKINADDSVHGVLLLKPLPSHIDEKIVCRELKPSKDVDGVTEGSMAGIYSGSGLGYPPCTAAACIEILKFYGIELKGKKTVVIGRSLVIGKPVAMLLIKEDCTVTICHTKTTDMPKICQEAELLIVAAGKAKSIGSEYFNKGQIVIDVGINVDDDGNLCGDVDFSAAEGCVQAITPVPGGVGTVTTGILMKHVVEAATKFGGILNVM